MLYGWPLQRTSARATATGLLLLLALLALLLLPPMWQPGSTVGSNCSCGWPACGCLELTLEPYSAPAANFTPWAGVDVVPPGNPPAAQPTVTQAVPPATPPAVPTASVPTALPVPTQNPIPTAEQFPTPDIIDQ